jgi:TRAP-type mannitol/chloroaromatic compound transport system permease small subunit
VKVAHKLADGIDYFIDLVGRATSWLALALALVMGMNVLLRYGFSIGRIWAQELEWHLLVPIVLFGMTYALRHGEHVRVDVLYGKFTPRTKCGIEIFAAMLGMAFAVIVIILSLHYVGQSWAANEGSPNPGGMDHRYIIKSLIPIGFTLLFFQFLSELIKGTIAFRGA